MRFSIYQDTELGARSVNQDRMGYCFTRDALLMVVADGMGGHLRGEVAAQITLQTVAALFQTMARPALEDPAEFLDMSLRRAHRDILRYQEQHNLPESPRTTVVACLVQKGVVWWAHAGDSRIYLIRDGVVLARTRDHSKVQTLISLGLLKPGEEEQHPERNKVLNCLGSPFEPTIEISTPVTLQAGDRLLLCSDGLWSGVPEAQLASGLCQDVVSRSVPELVQRAVATNGRLADNTTALALAWEGDSEGTPTDDGGLSSLDLPDGAFTTTISAAAPPEEADERDISEDEIERTIREIRTAIDRTNGR
ncbi:MAG TPA: serine/threonine-protein phosphatase [Burkholderiaceae bacterium]|nr:serine/threonine-protein phosphatase [Burkholderiaceae bacterium]